MANIRKFTSGEAASLDAAGEWNVQEVESVATEADTHYEIGAATAFLLISPSQDIRIRFSSGATDATDADDDLVIPAMDSGWTTVRVPRGISGTVYLHMKAVSAASSVKIVEW